MTTDVDACKSQSLSPCDESAVTLNAAELALAFHRADDDGPLQLTVQSLPYVTRREHADKTAALSVDASGRRRVSVGCSATSDPLQAPLEPADKFLTSLSYSVPCPTRVSNTPRGSPAVDVIATYMNTCDQRTVKLGLMRAHARFASSRGTQPLGSLLPLFEWILRTERGNGVWLVDGLWVVLLLCLLLLLLW